MSNDVRRFDDVGPFWVFTWAGPLETAVVLTLIALEVGIVPAITGVSTLLLVIPLQGKLAGKIAGLRAQAASQTDERVRITGVLCLPSTHRHSSTLSIITYQARLLTKACSSSLPQCRRLQATVLPWSCISCISNPLGLMCVGGPPYRPCLTRHAAPPVHLCTSTPSALPPERVYTRPAAVDGCTRAAHIHTCV